MPTPTATDLDVLLGLNGSIDTARATLLLGLATDLCSSIVTPLPDASRAVVLSIAARAYANPTGMAAQTVGPESVQYGTQYGGTAGGIYLTKQDRATLRRIAGTGGAFTVDPTPADAGQGLPVWDQNVTWLDGIPLLTDRSVP
jgi:hypothetical protein